MNDFGSFKFGNRKLLLERQNLPPQFYLVTGGSAGSSTEILNPTTTAWQEASPFPRALFALVCGSPRGGSVVCAGGDDVGGATSDEVSDLPSFF